MASKYTLGSYKYLNTTPQAGKELPSTQKPNALYIAKYLKSQGYTKAGAQAVLANIRKESSFNPTIIERGVGGSQEIGGIGGIGLIQWTGQGKKRRGKLEKAANYSKSTRDSLDFQTKYLVSEVKGKKIAKILTSTQNPVEGTLELLYLNIRSGSAIRVKNAIDKGITPASKDIERVQRRVTATWEVQSIVDEVWGGTVEDNPTGATPTEAGTGNSSNNAADSASAANPDGVNNISNAKQSLNTPPAVDQLPIYTRDSFTRAQAQHLKKTLNGFVAFRLESIEEKDTGMFDNDNLNEYWIPLYVVLDVYNQYVSILDATAEPEKGTNTPGRKLTEFYTGYQDIDESKKEYEKECKFLTNEMHFSIDPMTCVLPKPVQNTKVYDSKKIPVPWRDPLIGFDVNSYAPGLIYKNGFHKNVVEALQRGLMRGESDDILNILVSCQLLQEELDKIISSNKDSDQNEGNDMVSFVRIILKACNEALGGINDLDMLYDEQDDRFYIIDRKITPALRQVLPTLTLSGVRSTISKLSISSKISSNIGSMISIAAQGTGGHTKDNIAPLLEWNRGLLDRHIVHKSQKNTEGNDQVKENRETPEDERLKKWTLAYYAYWEELNGNSGFWHDNGDYDRAAVSNIKGYHKEWCQKWVVDKRSKSKDNPLPAPGVIPVELSFTTMGIGGLKIGQAFLVEEGILPFQYSENFGFIITGLSHSIADGKWTTDVKTQFYSSKPPTPEEIAFFNEKHNSEAVPYQNVNSASPTSGGSSGSVTTAGATLGEQGEIIVADGQDPAPIINPNKLGSRKPTSSKGMAPVIASKPLVKAWGSKARTYGKSDVIKGAADGIFAPIGGPGTPGAKWQSGASSNVNGSYYLETKAAAQFVGWYNEMVAAGIKFTVSSALRFGSNVGGGVHGYGIAVDFATLYRLVGGLTTVTPNMNARITQPVWKQMAEIGAKYGWYNPWRLSDGRSMEEVWHFEYYGPA